MEGIEEEWAGIVGEELKDSHFLQWRDEEDRVQELGQRI